MGVYGWGYLIGERMGREVADGTTHCIWLWMGNKGFGPYNGLPVDSVTNVT